MFRGWLHALWFRLRSLAKGRRLDRDLDDELKFHMAMHQQKLVEQGMPPEEARYAARRAFGNPTQTKEATRDLWTFPFLETLGPGPPLRPPPAPPQSGLHRRRRAFFGVGYRG